MRLEGNIGSCARPGRIVFELPGIEPLADIWFYEASKHLMRIARPTPHLKIEQSLVAKGYVSVAGVDEVGRGPLAGPVVTAAVVLKYDCELPGVRDSKLMTDAARRRLLPLIIEQCVSFGVGIVEAAEIDRLNILQATFAAMRKSLDQVDAQAVIVDGSQSIPNCTLTQQVLPKADNISLSVAAASVIAKVTRDDIMLNLDALYPQYGFGKHKGYATATHFAALDEHGPSPVHRNSFLVRWRERSAQTEIPL